MSSVLCRFLFVLCLSTTVTVSNAFIRTHRQCNVVLRNQCTSHTLKNPGLYMVSGTATVSMPPAIGANMETHVEFRKKPYAASGAVGVLTYDLVDVGTGRVDKRLAFMFSVPFNYMFHSNWFAAGFFPKSKACDHSLYREMYYKRESSFVRRKAAQLVAHKDGKFTVKATMTNTHTPDMTVDVYDG